MRAHASARYEGLRARSGSEPCMVRLGSGRFGVGFWVGFWVGLRARDFPTERVLSRTPLIIRTVDHVFCALSSSGGRAYKCIEL